MTIELRLPSFTELLFPMASRSQWKGSSLTTGIDRFRRKERYCFGTIDMEGEETTIALRLPSFTEFLVLVEPFSSSSRSFFLFS